MKQNVPSDPVQIGLLRPDASLQKSGCMPGRDRCVETPSGLRRRIPGCERDQPDQGAEQENTVPPVGVAFYRRKEMTLKRMDNVLIVVDDLESVKSFFIELGLELEGETTVEGPLIGSLIGLKDVRATLAMLRTPDGQGIELDKFHTPDAIRFGPVDAPVNTLGIRRIMFSVGDIDGVVARMRAHGAELIGEMKYEDTYRLAYIRGPEGIIVALAEQLG